MLARSVVILAVVAMTGVAMADEDRQLGKLGDFFKKKGKKAQLKPCMGDTRFGKKKEHNKPICQHLGFRFCMRLITDGGEPYLFGDAASENSTEKVEDINSDGLDWWEWSTQPQHKKSWIQGIKDTGGNHWCTCALCTSEAVDRFGCDKLDIQCDATDMAFIRYRVEHDGHKVLKSGLECLEQKCGKDYQKDWPVVGSDCKHRGCARLYGAGYEHSLMPLKGDNRALVGLSVAMLSAFLVSVVVGVRFFRSATPRSPLLAVDEELIHEEIE